MLGCSFHNRISSHFIIQYLCFPVVWHSLRADDSALLCFLPLIEYLMDGLDLILIRERVEKKIIQNQQFYTAQMLFTATKLLFVGSLEKHETVSSSVQKYSTLYREQALRPIAFAR